MTQELDFEELDNLMDEMIDSSDITASIAADVAKVDEIVAKPPKKKPATKKKKAEPTKKVASKKSESTEKPEAGEKVLVKILTKPQPEEEPEEPEFKPNPKTGKFMDVVSPLSDMSIKGQRPTKGEASIEAVPIVEVVSTTATVITTAEPELEELAPPPAPEIDPAELENKERITRNGLDPDATLEELTDKLEEIDDEDDYFDSIMEDLEDEFDTPEDEAPEPEEEVTEKEIEKLADILDIPDRSDAFLENVEIEKRPLGGGDSIAEQLGAQATSTASLTSEEIKEELADEEFIKDKIPTKHERSAKSAKPEKIIGSKPEKIKPIKKSHGAVLYILLIILFVILGCSLGALAYFSGLF